MKIKKLSVLGFKSFMDRIEIAFPSGISGIVGPNGCGKSNVVDAIRWCMGEQSPKQLRGRKMEDIIFGGAKDHKPLGMAEVSLTFENGNKSFPAQYENLSELSITRRLYRSGESEYRINNMPCRLKDIHEMFMDTGLGNAAYSIIGQGRIGAIIEQKPEETRIMLEEAAGITKYRKKALASQKKIEATEANLQRVDDILGEVETQMRSLKRQAGKAKRYKTICEEIQRLELILYSNTCHQLIKDSGNKLKSTESLNQAEIAASTELSSLQAQIETMELEQEEKDHDLTALRDSYLNLRERTHKKEAGLESLDREVRMQEELESRLKAEQDEIRQRLVGLKDEKENLETELENLKEKHQGLATEISLHEERLKNRKDSLLFVKEEYEKGRNELNSGVKKEVGLNHASDYLKKMLSQITDSRSRLEKELTDIQSKMEVVISASERKNLAREATQKRLKELESAMEAHQQTYEELAMIRTRIENEVRSAESELNSAQTRLSSLQSLTDNFEGYQKGVRTILKAEDFAPRQEGRIIGIVADMVQAPAEYEQAVEAALADRLQYVVVESQDDGRQAVDYLKQREKGRGSFVPVNHLSENGNHAFKNGFFPVLSDLVTVSEKYRPVINALLGDTLFVENLGDAITAWANFKNDDGHKPCFVTRQGDLVDQRGVITGGKLGKYAGSGLLARKREVNDLKVKVSTLETTVNDLRRRLEDVVMEAEDKNEEIRELTQARATCQDELNELDNQLFRVSQEMDQLDQLSRKISEDMARNLKEQDKNKAELAKIEQELTQHKTYRDKEASFFHQKELELKESEEEYEVLREELTRLKGDYRIHEEEQRSMAREKERLIEYATDSQQRLQKIEEEVDLSHRRCREGERRKEEIREQLKDLFEKLKTAEQEVQKADHDRQEFHARIKGKEDQAEQMRGEISDLKEKVNLAKMEHSELSFKMNNLLEMVQDKFNLDLKSVYEQHLEEDYSHSEAEERIEHQKNLRQKLGEVNLVAIKEHEALQERHEFILKQKADLLESIEKLRTAIRKINRTSLEKFRVALQEVDAKMKEIFPILFNGGTAGLRLTDEAKPLESGVLVEVQPPGKKLVHMGLLSGGEKALVAMALLFAIYMIRPSPFCLLDEVDAPLDEANIDRFNNLLGEIKRLSQVIMVTHSRRTMEIVDRLFGVTMENAGMSKVVSVDIINEREGNGVEEAVLH